MIEITYQSVVDGLSAIVAERGEDFVYPRYTGLCTYVYGGMPDCGVGCFLSSVGVPLGRLAEADSSMGVAVDALLEQLEREGIVSADEDAKGLLGTFQERQDNGYTWGSALDEALRQEEAKA